LLTELGDDAKLLAGGHSLLPMMKLRFAQPGTLIDINRIPELRGIREEGGLTLSDILHQAAIRVDEAGTEAGASTAEMLAGAAPDTVYLTVDRPFIFAIRDVPTGSILFLGRVANPKN